MRDFVRNDRRENGLPKILRESLPSSYGMQGDDEKRNHFMVRPLRRSLTALHSNPIPGYGAVKKTGAVSAPKGASPRSALIRFRSAEKPSEMREKDRLGAIIATPRSCRPADLICVRIRRASSGLRPFAQSGWIPWRVSGRDHGRSCRVRGSAAA